MSHDPEELDPYTFGAEQACFGCGPHNERGLKLRFTRQGDEVVTRFLPKADHGLEGPPGFLHGGLQATLADELAAWTLIGVRGRMGFTSTIDVRLLRPARIGIELVGHGMIAHESERSTIVRVRFEQGGKTTLRGRVTYALPSAEQAERILGRAIPDLWRRFCK